MARIMVSPVLMLGFRHAVRRSRAVLLECGLVLLVGAPVAGGEPVCQRYLDQATNELPDACVFLGSYDRRCGTIRAVFSGDGTAVVVSLAPMGAPPLFVAAQALSATEGKVVLWRPDLDLQRAPAIGSVRLEDGGRRLVLQLQAGLVTANGCPLEEFVGSFAGMVVAASPPTSRLPVVAVAGSQAH